MPDRIDPPEATFPIAPKARLDIKYSKRGSGNRAAWTVVYVGRGVPPVTDVEVEIMNLHLNEPGTELGNCSAQNDNHYDEAGVL